MALDGPNEKDVQKIHAEINQIVNQRFIITTVAITAFGAIFAWIIPKETPEYEVGTLTFIGSVLLNLILFALFFVSHLLRVMLRVFTTYLVVTRKSSWESDYEKYRRKGFSWGHTKPQTIFFLLLGAISISYPIVLARAYNLSLTPQIFFGIYVAVGILYFILVPLLGFYGKFDPENNVKKKWETLNNEKKS